MSMKQIRDQYGVPARRGGRVIYNSAAGPRPGTITGASGPHIRIRLDGDAVSMPFHPTWKLEYLEAQS